MKKHLLKIIAGIIVILFLTNPTQSDYDRFSGCNSELTNDKCGRSSYFLVFSFYHTKDSVPAKDRLNQIAGYHIYNKRYFGILKNFIPLRTEYSYSGGN